MLGIKLGGGFDVAYSDGDVIEFLDHGGASLVWAVERAFGPRPQESIAQGRLFL